MVQSVDIIKFMEVFAYVAKYQSFSQAANHLNLSKSSISLQINALEKSLGVKLLQRTTRKLSLTEAGKHFLNHCQRVVTEKNQAIVTVKNFTESPCGLLRVTAPPSFAAICLGKFIPQFLKRYPNIQIDLEVSEVVKELLDDNLDLAIRNTLQPDDQYVAKKIIDFNEWIVATPRYCEQHGKPEHAEDLNNYPCLVYSLNKSCSQWELVKNDHKTVINIKPIHSVNNYQNILEALYADIGIARLPEYLINEALEKKQLIKLLPEYTPKKMRFYALYHPAPVQSLKLKLFIEELERFLIKHN